MCSLAEAIRDAIAGDNLQQFSIINNLFFAEVKDHVGDVVVTPAILCKEVKEQGSVRAKQFKGASPSINDNFSDTERDTVPKRVLFFVQSTERGITKIPSTKYIGKPLCVYAGAEDTLEYAINNDGRFKDGFKLFEAFSHQQAEIPRHYAARDYHGKTFNMKKTRKRKFALVSEEKCPESQAPDKSTIPSGLPASVNEPSTSSSRERKNRTDKSVKFGKTSSDALPALSLPMLNEAANSIGFVKCGDCVGTCFLLRKHVIITSQHFIKNIYRKRKETTNKEDYQAILIYFRYLKQLELGECAGQIDETKIYSGGDLHSASNDGLDYAICYFQLRFELKGANKQVPLGPRVRRELPSSGLVVVFGHPEGKYKKFEPCPILPSYNWHSKLCERACEAEQYCAENPHECTGSTEVMETQPHCVHHYRYRYRKGEHLDELPYDTSFFHGASGSPVFNTNGHIVAMHTEGYTYYKAGKKYSLMEFGLAFSAIYRDVVAKYGPRFAKRHFPNCGH